MKIMKIQKSVQSKSCLTDYEELLQSVNCAFSICVIALIDHYREGLRKQRSVRLGGREWHLGKGGVGQRDPNSFWEVAHLLGNSSFQNILPLFFIRQNALVMKKCEFSDACMRANYGCVH